MKKTLLNILTVATLFFASAVYAQVGVGVPAENMHPSAELEVKSTNKGFLPPRMTKAERDAIVAPAAGLLIYQTDGDVTNPTGLYFYDGTSWKNGLGVTGAEGIKGDPGLKGDNGQQGTAATFPNGTVSGQILYWNGYEWVASPPGENGQTLTLVDGLPVWQKTLDATTSCPATLKIKTGNISNIKGISADCSGEIFGSASPVSAAGVCWSTSPNPTIANSFTEDDPDDGCDNGLVSFLLKYSNLNIFDKIDLGVGKFTSQIKGLTQNTTYYVRAYATNDEGTYYGEQIIFKAITIVVPTVTTMPIENLPLTSAKTQVNVTDNGGSPVTEKGVCWSTSPNPTIADSVVTRFEWIYAYLNNLTPSTTYYMRAFATNVAGTGYGEEISFTTTIFMPTLTTTASTNISAVSAEVGGNFNYLGNVPISEVGVCWSTSPNPSILNSHTTQVTNTSFSSTLLDLTPNTTYYAKTYGVTSFGIVYGDEISFTTPTLILPTLTSKILLIDDLAVIDWSISKDGNLPIITRGICGSTSPNPTIADKLNQSSVTVGTVYRSTLSLTSNTKYYLRSYATNGSITIYGNELIMKTPPVKIGEPYQGGIMAYLFHPGEWGYIEGEAHGLIAAPSDLPDAKWGCSNSPTYAWGFQASYNTNKILNVCSTAAALSCSDLVLNGYDDWWMPTEDELIKFQRNQSLIKGFSKKLYWSSSENMYDYTKAKFVNFGLLALPLVLNQEDSKDNSYGVRAVRYF